MADDAEIRRVLTTAYRRYDDLRGGMMPLHDEAFEALNRLVRNLSAVKRFGCIGDDFTTVATAHRFLDEEKIDRVKDGKELPIHERVAVLIERRKS